MSDAKFFTRGKVQEFREELIDDKKDSKFTKKRNALKKIVANMTMGNDMSALFPDVISCMQISDLEIKKMVYLYVVNYAKLKPDLVLMTVNSFLKDAADGNPLIRALALRTMAYIHVDKVIDCLCEPLRNACNDKDPYVRKTAAICVPKVYFYSQELAENEGLIESLKKLLYDSNPTVVSNALAALVEIHDKSADFDFTLDMNTASTLLQALNDCSEWGQTYIIEALMFVVPTGPGDAESLIERLYPRLQHANSGVVLAATKVVIFFLNYVSDQEFHSTAYRKLGPPLVTITGGEAETQYVALRNIIMIIQKRPDFLYGEMKVFFCKYNDPIYVKLSKLEVMFRLANENNVDIMLSELKEYATEVDVDFVRKAVRSIGRCAIKIESSADKCIQALVELIQTKVNYVVQEAVIVIRDIFRKYPNRYESILGVLCENLDSLDEPEAKASMIWIIGHYADRIENSVELFEGFTESFLEEPSDIQLAILTASIKMFIKRPNQAKTIVPKILKWATEEMDNPDVRDRGYFYWRLLSSDPMAAKSIVLNDQATIYTETDNMEASMLNELLLHIDTLASVYHRPPKALFPGLKHRSVKAGGAAPQYKAPATSTNHTMTSNPASSYNPYSNDVGYSKQTKAANLLDLDLDLEPSPVAAVPSYNTGFGGYGANSSAPVQSLGLNSLIDPLGGLGGGMDMLKLVSGGSTSYVAPKQQLLAANMAKGMDVHGTFARRGGNMLLELTVSNKALQPLSEFMIQFNKNSFGLFAGKFDMISPLIPNQTAEGVVPLLLNPANTQITNPFNTLHVAFKNNVGLFFFQCLIPLHVFFVEDGKLVQTDYLNEWRSTEPNSKTSQTVGFRFSSVDAFRDKLSLNNIFTIAERQADSKFTIFVSSKLIDGSAVLAELQLAVSPDGSVSMCYTTARSKNPAVAQLYADSISEILKS